MQDMRPFGGGPCDTLTTDASHIIGFHLYLDARPESLGFTSVLVVLFLLQAWVHRTNFKCLLNARPKAPKG